jgi:hypothetical protein
VVEFDMEADPLLLVIDLALVVHCSMSLAILGMEVD